MLSMHLVVREKLLSNFIKIIIISLLPLKTMVLGLGLYMSKIIIEKHMNGIIKIERLPQGSRFTIEFKLDS
jgi:nitrogen-specific signal transduction histidine kinase